MLSIKSFYRSLDNNNQSQYQSITQSNQQSNHINNNISTNHKFDNISTTKQQHITPGICDYIPYQYFSKQYFSIYIQNIEINQIIQSILWNKYYQKTLLKQIYTQLNKSNIINKQYNNKVEQIKMLTRLDSILQTKSSNETIYMKINSKVYNLKDKLDYQNHQLLQKQIIKYKSITIQKINKQSKWKKIFIQFGNYQNKSNFDIIFSYNNFNSTQFINHNQTQFINHNQTQFINHNQTQFINHNQTQFINHNHINSLLSNKYNQQSNLQNNNNKNNNSKNKSNNQNLNNKSTNIKIQNNKLTNIKKSNNKAITQSQRKSSKSTLIPVSKQSQQKTNPIYVTATKSRSKQKIDQYTQNIQNKKSQLVDKQSMRKSLQTKKHIKNQNIYNSNNHNIQKSQKQLKSFQTSLKKQSQLFQHNNNRSLIQANILKQVNFNNSVSKLPSNNFNNSVQKLSSQNINFNSTTKYQAVNNLQIRQQQQIGAISLDLKRVHKLRVKNNSILQDNRVFGIQQNIIKNELDKNNKNNNVLGQIISRKQQRIYIQKKKIQQLQQKHIKQLQQIRIKHVRQLQSIKKQTSQILNQYNKKYQLQRQQNKRLRDEIQQINLILTDNKILISQLQIRKKLVQDENIKYKQQLQLSKQQYNRLQNKYNTLINQFKQQQSKLIKQKNHSQSIADKYINKYNHLFKNIKLLTHSQQQQFN